MGFPETNVVGCNDDRKTRFYKVLPRGFRRMPVGGFRKSPSGGFLKTQSRASSEALAENSTRAKPRILTGIPARILALALAITLMCALLMLFSPTAVAADNEMGLAGATGSRGAVGASGVASAPDSTGAIGNPGGTEAAAAATGRVEEFCSMTVVLVVSPEKYASGEAAMAALFEPTVFYEDDSFSGDLDLKSISYEASYQTIERQIERVEWYQGLPAADIIHIPTSREYEIASDAAPGATTMATLEMTAITWTPEGFDAAGRPTGQTAEVTYRGVERELVVGYYTVTATYSGLFVEEPLPLPAPLPLPSAPITEIVLHLPEVIQEIDLPLPAAATALAVVLLGVLAFVLFFRHWNVRLIAVRENGSVRIILRKHVRLIDGTATLQIPDHCALTSPAATHLVRVKQALVGKGGNLAIVWRECLLFQFPLEREIDLQHRLFELVALPSVLDLVDEAIE